MHPNKWAIAKGFLTEDQCDHIVELAAELKRQRGSLKNYDTNPLKNTRLCDVVWFSEHNATTAGLNDEIANMYQVIDEKFNGVVSTMGLDHWQITDRESFQYTEYNGAGEWYDWHKDSHKEPYPELDEHGKPHRWPGLIRKLSMSIFLNDPSEWKGGNFEIENTWEKPPSEAYDRIWKFGPGVDYCKKGNALIFQSDCYHRVNRLTSGNRKSLVAWYLGPQFT